jgi:hypothetical protein
VSPTVRPVRGLAVRHRHQPRPADLAAARPQLAVAARARIALELAREDMRFLKHERIAPGHVLLGLIQVPQGIAALILESMGLSLAQVRTRVLGAIPLDESSPRSYWRNAGAAPSPEQP